MTTICGYRDPKTGDVWLAADSRTSQDDFIFPAEPLTKIRNIGKWWMAIAGSAALDRVLKRQHEALTAAPGIDEFIEALFGGLESLNWKPEEGTGPPAHRLTLIVSDGLSLWTLYSTGGAREHADGFHAAGAGQDFAWGAWYTLKHIEPTSSLISWWTPKGLLSSVLGAAARYNAATGGEITIVNVSECQRIKPI